MVRRRFNGMFLCLYKYADLIPELHITLTEYSPLASLLPNYNCTLAQLFKEVLKFSLRGIYEAIAEEEGEDKGLLEREVPVEMGSRSVSEYDELCQSVSMSDIYSSLATRKSHKKWSKAEEIELMKILKKYKTNKIPEEVWNEPVLKFNRTTTSLYAKAKTLLKK